MGKPYRSDDEKIFALLGELKGMNIKMMLVVTLAIMIVAAIAYALLPFSLGN